jgi:hypothetical protein
MWYMCCLLLLHWPSLIKLACTLSLRIMNQSARSIHNFYKTIQAWTPQPLGFLYALCLPLQQQLLQVQYSNSI